MEVHAVHRCDGPTLQPINNLWAFAVFQRAFIANGPWFVLFFTLLRSGIGVLGKKKKILKLIQLHNIVNKKPHDIFQWQIFGG